MQMKKAEIKRRKRVVPAHLAGDDQASVYTTESAEEDRTSMQPPASPYADTASYAQQAQIHEPQMQALEPSEPHPPGGPIPIDFTNAFRARPPLSEADSNPRKRSFSATLDDPQQHHQHAQNVSSPNYHNLDPSLSEPSESSTSQQAEKLARRAQLQAEAERMRIMLVEKEREIAAMGEIG